MSLKKLKAPHKSECRFYHYLHNDNIAAFSNNFLETVGNLCECFSAKFGIGESTLKVAEVV
jgi:hypothetical protein